MKIDRNELISRLIEFARAGNGIIVGKPGVGKSYAIAQVRDELKKHNVSHLILPVERLGDGSDADVKLVLKRQGDLVALLRDAANQTSAREAFLIFDGFDAARGERQREGILKLIARAVSDLSDVWRVIVSVRVFDARKSARLLALFPRLPSEQASDDIECRHIYVPPLAESELQQAFEQNSTLGEVYRNGSAELRNLLSIPFHLWLVEKALGAGTSVSAFSAVTSEVQLLDLYWKRRVTTTNDADDRRFLLTKATDAMVRSHTLAVRRESIYQPAAANAWEGLLSDEILAEQSDTDSVSFSHNILFDFAVSALLLQTDPASFARFIAEEPARPLFLRPSLVYHFTRLWHFDRDDFWKNFWHATSRDEIHLRQIIRIVLPAVVIAEARSLSDLAPLQLKLAQGDSAAIEAIAFTIQALRILGPVKPDLWSEFIRALAPHLHRRFAWDAGLVVLAWLESHSDSLTNDARNACGDFGRRLLEWSWSMRNDPARTWFERVAALLGIPIVAKTFATEPQESQRLLQQVLSVVDEPGFPIDCTWRLTHEVDTLMSQAPNFVAEIYERVFGHEETSDEKTNMGGPILGLISNRRQDYDGCEYNLLQSFSKFVKSAPAVATIAGIRALEAHVRRDHIERYLKPGASIRDLQKRFAFRGMEAVYTSDGSAIWDESKYPDRELSLAGEIFGWLRTLAEGKDTDQVSSFLRTFAQTASYAFLWKRLLQCGADAPAIVGSAIWELAVADPLLHGTDVRYALGEYLKHVSSHLSPDVRQRIETSILKIPATGQPSDDSELLERRRNRLLGCIPQESLITDDAIALRNQLDAQSSIPSNEPPFKMTSWSGEYSEEDFLREKGAKPEMPENKNLRDLYLPLKTWNEKGRDASQIDSLMATARQVRTALLGTSSAEPPVLLAAWTNFAEFTTHAILETDGSTPRFSELREMVLLAADHNEPVPDEEEDSRWKSAVWSPAPRTSAAQALPWIAAFDADEKVLTAIKKLAADPVPTVRFLLADGLWRLGKTAPDTMWPLLENLVAVETNEVVLGAVTRSLSYAWRLDKDRSLPLVCSLLNKPHTEDENTFGFWHDAVRIITDFAVWEKATSVAELFQTWLKAPLLHKSELATSGQRLIGYIRPQQSRASFDKARELLIEHLDSIARGLTELQRVAIEQGTFVSPETWRKLYSVIDETVLRIYFATDVAPNLRQHAEHPLDDISRPKFFRDALPILEKVLSFGKTPESGVLLAPTAHHFMELLNGVIKYDPQQVLRLAADVIESSKRYNYNLDGMAMREVVKLVESLLADYREYIQDDKSVTHLLNVLDAFVEAGWPEALNLVWRLDEVYR
jgi:hypothetical protein